MNNFELFFCIHSRFINRYLALGVNYSQSFKLVVMMNAPYLTSWQTPCIVRGNVGRQLLISHTRYVTSMQRMCFSKSEPGDFVRGPSMPLCAERSAAWTFRLRPLSSFMAVLRKMARVSLFPSTPSPAHQNKHRYTCTPNRKMKPNQI